MWGHSLRCISPIKTSRSGSRQFEIFQNPSPNKKIFYCFHVFTFVNLNTQITFYILHRNITLYHTMVGFYAFWRGRIAVRKLRVGWLISEDDKN